MTKWILAAGAAALAFSAPTLAQKDKGGGQGKGGQQAAKVERGGDNARAAKADRGGSNRVARVERGGGDDDDKRQARAVNRSAERGNFRIRDDNRGKLQVRGGDERRAARIDDDRNVRAVRIDDDRRLRGVKFDDDQRVVRVENDRFLRIDNDRVLRIDDDRFDRRFAGLGLIDGCPPGLARKNNGCLPPGQAKRVLANGVLTNNVFGLGAVLPATFAGTRIVPNYYRDYDRGLLSNFLLDDDDYYYRYDNGYMYRVDRDYNIVAGLIPLLGGGYSMGQPYPLGYSAYNVPYQYRSYYADDDDYYYRYGDGGIYQVNRSTGLIAAIVSLLAGGLSVGQPLPLGYDAYNVPYAHRTTYYDTPDTWYRYNDGYIYDVDPRTRIVRNVIYV